jgi:hypothetical protein
MKTYYLNPKNGDLLIFDTEEQEIQIVERIQKVKVWVKGEVRLGDFDGPNGGETPEDQIARTGRYKNHNLTSLRKKKGQRICKKCGQPGHIAKTCPN